MCVSILATIRVGLVGVGAALRAGTASPVFSRCRASTSEDSSAPAVGLPAVSSEVMEKCSWMTGSAARLETTAPPWEWP